MGKTWLAEELIRRYQRANPKGNVYKVSSKPEIEGAWWPPPSENKDGDLISADEDPTLFFPWVRAMTNYGRGPGEGSKVGPSGAMSLIDDFDAFVPKMLKNNHGSSPWYGFFTKYREYRCDIIGTCHRLEAVSNDIIGAAHYIYLFAQEERRSFANLCDLPAFQNLDTNMMREDPPQSRGQCILINKDPTFRGRPQDRVRRLNLLRKAA